MSKQITWTRSLSGKMAMIGAALLTLTLVLLAGGLYQQSTYQPRRMNLVGKGRSLAYRMLYLTERIISTTGPERASAQAELNVSMGEMDDRFRI